MRVASLVRSGVGVDAREWWRGCVSVGALVRSGVGAGARVRWRQGKLS